MEIILPPGMLLQILLEELLKLAEIGMEHLVVDLIHLGELFFLMVLLSLSQLMQVIIFMI
jgi:hypothetical protein